jgi:hypothetical protein
MANDVIGDMNRALGIGLALGVRGNQRFEYLRESHRRDAERAQAARDLPETDTPAPVRATHFFRGEELPGPAIGEASSDIP